MLILEVDIDSERLLICCTEWTTGDQAQHICKIYRTGVGGVVLSILSQRSSCRTYSGIPVQGRRTG